MTARLPEGMVAPRLRDGRGGGYDRCVAGFSITFLGTGTSVGVPVIGCDCAVCRSADPRNQRLRSSIVVRAGEVTVLVDSGPDLRAQALRENLREIDAVLYTHAHLDHVAGFDELRAFCWHRAGPLPMYGTGACLDQLRGMFAWAFAGENAYKGYVRPDPRPVEGPFQIGGLRISPLPVEHAAVVTVGFLFETEEGRRLAYLPDVKRIPPATMERISGVDALVVDALRPMPHPTHFSLEEALSAAREAGARRTWLTHLGHENDHAALQQELPEGVEVAWDGLQVALDGLA
jgi:phosphoribosyl 1,2-cyclic phosphate phosphodiesterase